MFTLQQVSGYFPVNVTGIYRPRNNFFLLLFKDKASLPRTIPTGFPESFWIHGYVYYFGEVFLGSS